MNTTVNIESHSEVPPNAVQKSGPTQYGTSLGYGNVPQLQTDVNAVQEVTYASGRLYAELNTGLASGTPGWPGSCSSRLRGRLVSATNVANGYVETLQNLLYPVIGVNANAQGGDGVGSLRSGHVPVCRLHQLQRREAADGSSAHCRSGHGAARRLQLLPALLERAVPLRGLLDGPGVQRTHLHGDRARRIGAEGRPSNWGMRLYWTR